MLMLLHLPSVYVFILKKILFPISLSFTLWLVLLENIKHSKTREKMHV